MSSLGPTQSRISKLCTCLSQFGNVVLFNGSPDESISGRAYRQGVLDNHAKWYRRKVFIEKIFFWHDDHCKSSHLSDVVIAYRILRYYKRKITK